MKFRHRHPSGIVLALGGGGAAGLAHIGVLQVLAENEIPVRAIAGTSIGAEIGAFFANGMSMHELEAVATSFDWKKTLQLFFPDLPTGGLISGSRIVDFLKQQIGSRRIEDLPIGYLAVAADLESGREVVLERGGLVGAVRSSISIPGVMAPYRLRGRWLVDGGVVNPVPFDVARDRFGGPVVAVSIHTSNSSETALPRETPKPSSLWPKHVRQLLNQKWMSHAPMLREWLRAQLQEVEAATPKVDSEWTTRRVLDRALTMASDQIIRLRARTNAPDLTLRPAVDEIGVLEFYHARQAIDAGRQVANAKLPELNRLGTGARRSRNRRKVRQAHRK